MNWAARIAAGLVGLLATWMLTQAPTVGRPPAGPAPTSAPRAAALNGLHGMAIQLHGSRESVPQYLELVDDVAALGANTVLFVTHGWQTHAATVDLHIDTGRNPPLPDLGRLCARARERGLRVILMPVVLLSDPRNTEWRGQINPTAGWDAWFERYTEFMLKHAAVAAANGVDVLMIGSELIKAEKLTDHWRRLIASVRQTFPGRLGYSANWDHYATSKIGFWPELDFVGMTSYYTLAGGPNPKLEEVLERWQPFKERILAFYDEVKKPIIFTEVGWCSQEGAASEAWNYYHNQKATPAGHREQAVCYEAFMRVWEDEPAVGGTIWWEWTAAPGGADNFDYTPKGKPAEKLLRDWFAKRNARPDDAGAATLRPSN